MLWQSEKGPQMRCSVNESCTNVVTVSPRNNWLFKRRRTFEWEGGQGKREGWRGDEGWEGVEWAGEEEEGEEGGRRERGEKKSEKDEEWEKEERHSSAKGGGRQGAGGGGKGREGRGLPPVHPSLNWFSRTRRLHFKLMTFSDVSDGIKINLLCVEFLQGLYNDDLFGRRYKRFWRIRYIFNIRIYGAWD